MVFRAFSTTVLAIGVILAVAVASAQAAVSLKVESVTHAKPNPLDTTELRRGDEYMLYYVTLRNSGDTATTAPTTLTVGLPQGIRLHRIPPLSGTSSGWSCFTAASSCMYSGAPVAGGASFTTLILAASIDPSTVPDQPLATFTAFGGGAAGSAIGQHSFTLAQPGLSFGLVEDSFRAGACFDATVLDPSPTDACAAGGLGSADRQAGGHPFGGNAAFDFKIKTREPTLWNGLILGVDFYGEHPIEDLRDGAVTLPPGFVANPTVVAGGCTIQQIQQAVCPERYAVGRTSTQLTAQVRNHRSTVFKLRPEKGYPARFAFKPYIDSPATVTLRGKVRPGDFTVSALIPNPPQFPPLYGVHYFTFCAYGSHTRQEVGLGGVSQTSDGCKQPDDPGAFSVPFLTNPTRCTGEEDVTSIDLASYQHPGSFDQDGFPNLSDPDWKSYEATSPTLKDCEDIPFDPSVTVGVTSSAPDSAAGLSFDLDVPQDGLVDPDGVASSHLDKTVVELPEGLSVNPSSATGLEACTDEQMGLVTRSAPGPFPVQFNGQPVKCPDGSKLGAVMVTSPLVDETLLGNMYLGEPKSTDPASGKMLRLFLVIRNDEIGLMAKLEGSTVADPKTGKLTATFDNNPQLPFDHLEVRLKGGDKGVLATPRECGQKTSDVGLEPWSGTGEVSRPSSFDVAGDCAQGFEPKLAAGMDTPKAAANGTFSFRFSRQDGEQQLAGLTARLPEGLAASLRNLPLCSNAQANAGTCPEASKIGIVDAEAGSGDPFVLERKGEVFLTESYKGATLGMAVKIRPVAGPFRGPMELSPIIVRQAVHVDLQTAQVTAVSDPFPLIHHGIPLRVREITVLVNRPGFMLNPTSCAPKQIAADLVSDMGATHTATSHFQVEGCRELGFKPRFNMRILDKGRRSTLRSWNPRTKFTVRPRQGDANMGPAVVTLPSTVILDQSNIKTLCTRAQFAEDNCPERAIYGYAKAWSPLLDEPVEGPVYMQANGGVRPIPDILADLRGQVRVALTGWVSTVRRDQTGRLRNTFNVVPDVPVTRFELTMRGGRNRGLLVNSTDLCRKRERGVARFTAANGRVSVQRPAIRMTFKGCKRVRKQAARRTAKRRAAKRRAVRRKRAQSAAVHRIARMAATQKAVR